jgi:preprotein translocase subunit Sss1
LIETLLSLNWIAILGGALFFSLLSHFVVLFVGEAVSILLPARSTTSSEIGPIYLRAVLFVGLLGLVVAIVAAVLHRSEYTFWVGVTEVVYAMLIGGILCLLSLWFSTRIGVMNWATPSEEEQAAISAEDAIDMRFVGLICFVILCAMTVGPLALATN